MRGFPRLERYSQEIRLRSRAVLIRFYNLTGYYSCISGLDLQSI